MSHPVSSSEEDSDSGSEETETYYHYTDKKGAKGIKESEMILASEQEGAKDDARYGDGVYLTTMDPESHTKEQIAKNNYNVSADTAKAVVKQGRIDYVVKVKIPMEDAPKRIDTNRNIYLYEGEAVYLSQYDYSIYKV